MITRTPPPRKRRADVPLISELSPDRPLVIYEDPPLVEHPHEASASDQMLCTYQCRQMVKSEVLDALGSAEKQVQDYQSKFEALSAKLQKSEAERKKFQDQFCYVEQELAAAQGREKALQEQLMKEVGDFQEQIEKQLKSNSEFEVKFKKEEELRRNAEKLVDSANERANLSEEKLSRLSESIEREKKRLHSELSLLQKESKLSVSRINADLERMECRATSAEQESTLLKRQLEELHERLNECLHQKNEMEKKLMSATFSSQEVSTDTNILVKHLQDELRNFESEVREARKLKSSHENNELLKEKLLEEKGRRERAESEILKLQEAQLTVKEMEDELMVWKSMIIEIPGVSFSADIPIKFAAFQKEVLESMMKVGEVSAQLKQMEVSLEATEHGKQRAETELAMAKEKAKESLSDVMRLEQILSSVTEERDRLLKDVNMMMKQNNVKPDGGSTNETLIQELETALSRRDCYIKELESKFNEQKNVINRQNEEINLLTERLNNEMRRVKSLEREGDRLRSEISLLESKLGHGDFSASSTKVLRMVNTLAVDSDAKHTIETLRAEMQKMKEKLQALEELKGQTDAGNMIDSNISEKLAQLKGQIATLEKREERYKTVFAEKISVFRKACCSLFGYKIVMDDHQRPNGIPVTRFTLQSIYAQSDEEKLEFEYESGSTNILANDYASQPEISRQVEIFVRKMNSIPAFTANLTVERGKRRGRAKGERGVVMGDVVKKRLTSRAGERDEPIHKGSEESIECFNHLVHKRYTIIRGSKTFGQLVRNATKWTNSSKQKLLESFGIKCLQVQRLSDSR
ncbi:hypothetical protein Sjap_021281 [Stephania japonica]|uniref:Mitotic spindle checkpoint protein MAD1 n=1 Tax=Stephania japonica TaxID=461633 RepID=A0AAP0EVJ8_9MAGN